MLSSKNSPLGKQLDQYVCVRITRMDDVDVGLFDRDWNNAIYFFLMNADEQIYMRYGGRDAQAGGLKGLEDATAQAVSIMQAACPDETPITPPGRLDAMEKRLQAMIEAANTVKPALSRFYASLNAEQKARFNRIGGQLAAQTTGQAN